MFNFFDEIKKSMASGQEDVGLGYQLINIGGRIIYFEGHLGLTQLSKEVITFKIKGGRISIEGEKLCLVELTSNTLKISGEITKIEVI